MPAPITREYRIYLALWRKSLSSDEPIRIKCSNKNMAVAMRQGLYRAIKPFRHNEQLDVELFKASEKFVVYLEPEEDRNAIHYLQFKERVTLAELEGMWDELGLEEDDLLLGDERAASEAVRSIMERAEETTPRKTPFYSREG